MEKTIVIIVLLSIFVLCKFNKESPDTIILCQDIYLLLGTHINVAKVVGVENGTSVHLLCHFCSEYEDTKPKVWYFKPKGLSCPMKAICTGNRCHRKTSVTADHTLIIHGFNHVYDSGIYKCLSQSKEHSSIFSYVLEGIFKSNNLPPIVGSLVQWQEYKSNKINPINKQFQTATKEPFLTFHNKYRFSFRVKTSWEPWGICESSNQLNGIRKKIGKCLLYVVPSKPKQMTNTTQEIELINSFYSVENYDVPCRSITLNETLPYISQIVKNIPDYIAVAPCTVHRPNVLLETNVKVNKYKFSIVKQIPESGYCTITCPGAKSDSDIQWFKDEIKLGSFFWNNMGYKDEEPHLTIDSYNTLYILRATKQEEGNYSCTINGKYVQNCQIKIVAKSKILNEGLQKRCIRCRSRGELGSCRDPFPFNVTEPEAEAGIHIEACPSGWCAKVIEGTTGAYRTDDYGAATQRMCLQRPPSDYEERCAYTMFNHKKVYMCFCNGDLCNSAHRTYVFPSGIVVSVLITIYNYMHRDI